MRRQDPPLAARPTPHPYGSNSVRPRGTPVRPDFRHGRGPPLQRGGEKLSFPGASRKPRRDPVSVLYNVWEHRSRDTRIPRRPLGGTPGWTMMMGSIGTDGAFTTR